MSQRSRRNFHWWTRSRRETATAIPCSAANCAFASSPARRSSDAASNSASERSACLRPQPYMSRIAASRKRIELNGRPGAAVGFPFRRYHFAAVGAAQLEAHHGEAARIARDIQLAEVDLAEVRHLHYVAVNGRRGVRVAIPMDLLHDGTFHRAMDLGKRCGRPGTAVQ